MKLSSLFTSLCILSAAACAELDQADCERGDWMSIGQRDGSRGRSADFVERHGESCARYGVTVDPAVWEQGRQQGLRVFCTPEAQYQAGRDGRPFNRICAAENLPVHREAYEKGRKYFLLTQRIEHLRIKHNRLRRASLAEETEDRSSPAFEAFMLRMDINILLRERRQYEAF